MKRETPRKFKDSKVLVRKFQSIIREIVMKWEYDGNARASAAIQAAYIHIFGK